MDVTSQGWLRFQRVNREGVPSPWHPILKITYSTGRNIRRQPRFMQPFTGSSIHTWLSLLSSTDQSQQTRYAALGTKNVGPQSWSGITRALHPADHKRLYPQGCAFIRYHKFNFFNFFQETTDALFHWKATEYTIARMKRAHTLPGIIFLEFSKSSEVSFTPQIVHRSMCNMF